MSRAQSVRAALVFLVVAASAAADPPQPLVTAAAASPDKAPILSRPCALTMAHLPAAPVSAIKARIEIPAIYAVIGNPSVAIAGDPRVMHAVGVSKGDDGQHILDLAVLFPEPTPLAPRILEFTLGMPDADRLPEPLIIRHFAALGANGRVLRDARAELLVSSVEPLAQ